MVTPRLLFCIITAVSLCVLSVYAEDSEAGSEESFSLVSAVEGTLKNQVSILIQQNQVSADAGQLKSARGSFDWGVDASAGYVTDKTPLTQEQATLVEKEEAELGTTSYGMGLNKMFRSGISLGSGLTFSSGEDLSFDTEDVDSINMNLSLTVPVDGRGTTVYAAQERAAQAGLAASRHELRHSVAGAVYNTVSAYWQYVAALQQLAIHRDSETQAQKMVEDTKALAAADERPAADIDQLAANLADKQATRIAFEQNVYAARRSLGKAMGSSPAQILGQAMPGDDFPVVSSNLLEAAKQVDAYMAMSVEHRDDLSGARLREAAASYLAEAARRDTRSHWNVVLQSDYTITDDKNPEPQYAGDETISMTVALQYEYPLGNNSAEGNMQILDAQLEQARLKAGDLARTIRIDVSVALNDLVSGIQSLEKAVQAVAGYRDAVANEKQKLQMGMSTVLDVVTMEDRLRSALLNEVNRRQSVADSVVKLRFETGTLVARTGDLTDVDAKRLITIPTPKQ